ncbi:alpha/beta fold hydrolase [Haloglycomyces albus]|uniref:alpha/beta fold hydrolase n=1 Tax=Haloglycomyces albus TaxID=526067 RepID=UPI00046CA7FC|nr:alpha/beta fold hydrolase [Haloglycomyces albus]
MSNYELNHHRQGHGEPLLLFHGIGHRWQAWEPILDRLAEYHEVIAVDLPGFGESPVPPNGVPTNMDEAVAEVARFLRDQSIEKPHVAGNSLGGAIALELADHDLVASCTALSPAGFFTPGEARRGVRILKRMRASTYWPKPILRTALRLPFVRDLSYKPIIADPTTLPSQRLLDDARALRRGKGFRPIAKEAPRYSFRGEPKAPTTVAWGTNDRILRPRQAIRAQVRLPEVRHLPLEGCGHVPMSDDPTAVAEAILTTTGARHST